MKVKSKQQRDFKKTLEFIPNYLDIGPRGGSLPDGALPLGIAHVCGACFDVLERFIKPIVRPESRTPISEKVYRLFIVKATR